MCGRYSVSSSARLVCETFDVEASVELVPRWNVAPSQQAPIVRLAARGRCGSRMEFDPEILVRAVWEGMPVVSMPTRVTYPLDGISHFKMWRDNVRISWMHTRLFFGMLWRAPMILLRRLRS